MFDFFETKSQDAIENTFRRAAADQRPDIINLSIGVYRDVNGHVPIMEVVRDAQLQAVKNMASKSYLTPAGNTEFCRLTRGLLLGEDHNTITNGRIRAVQTPGAGSALRVAAELARSLKPDTVIWFSTPVWNHQVDFFKAVGLSVKYYDYYDKSTQSLNFDAMLTSLEAASPEDIIVLHGVCHNPTGADLSYENWQTLTHFLRARDLVPLVDIAYQGYGKGLEADAAGLRYMAAHMSNMLIVYSASKSFAVYRDRVGALFMIMPESGSRSDAIFDHVIDLIRALYFMPPDSGAEIVATILRDSQLRKRWAHELGAIRADVVDMRQRAYQAFQAAMPDLDLSALGRQNGMFSCLPITEDNRLALEKDKGIYLLPGGRINFASLSPKTLDYVAQSFIGYLEPQA